MSSVIQGELEDEVMEEQLLLETFDNQDELPDEEVASAEPDTGTITVPLNVIKIIGNAPSGQEILQTCIDLAVFLSSKNISYGNSALNPVRVFSKATAKEQLLVRIDDKINRLMKGEEFPDDDTVVDLVGYLILYLVARGNDNPSNEDG